MLNVGQVLPNAPSEHMLAKLGWQFVNLPLEVRNSYENWHLLEKARKAGRAKCLSTIEKASGPILITMSGGSLDGVIDDLVDWKPPIMCSTTQLSTLIHAGRPPEYCVCIDPRVAEHDTELNAPDFGNTVFLAHPSVPYLYLQRWLTRTDNTLYMSRLMEPDYDFYSHHLGTAYPWIKHIMRPMIDSAAACIAHATWLGYNPIYLIGVDYGGPRMVRWDWMRKQWKPDGITSGYEVTDDKDEGAGGLTATGSMAYSSRGTLLSTFMQMANKQYQQRVFQLSSKSALDMLPQVKWENALASQGQAPWIPMWDRKKIMEDIEIMLAAWNTFLIPSQGGWETDYVTYLADNEVNLEGVLRAANRNTLNNLKNFAAIEKAQQRPLKELMIEGKVTAEFGSLLLYPSEAFADWDWRKIRPIDVPSAVLRCRELVEKAKERGYSKEGVKPSGKTIQQQFLEGPVAPNAERIVNAPVLTDKGVPVQGPVAPEIAERMAAAQEKAPKGGG